MIDLWYTPLYTTPMPSLNRISLSAPSKAKIIEAKKFAKKLDLSFASLIWIAYEFYKTHGKD